MYSINEINEIVEQNLNNNGISIDDVILVIKSTDKDYYRLHSNIFDSVLFKANKLDKIPLLSCKTRNGLFLIGIQIDFNIPEKDTFKNLKTTKCISINEPLTAKFVGSKDTYDIVCWKI